MEWNGRIWNGSESAKKDRRTHDNRARYNENISKDEMEQITTRREWKRAYGRNRRNERDVNRNMECARRNGGMERNIWKPMERKINNRGRGWKWHHEHWHGSR